MAFPTGERSTSAVLLQKEMPTEIILGVPIEFRIEVENLTERTLEAVEVSDAIPEGFVVESTQPPAIMSGTKAVWQLGVLAPRSVKTLSVRGSASELGAFTTCASVTYESMLCATANVVSPSLEVQLSAPAEGLACDPIEVTVRVANSGTGDARGVRVIEELPEGLTTLGGRRRIQMEFGTLASNQSKEQVVKLKATRGGTFTQTASAEATGGIRSEADPVTSILRMPRLDISMAVDPSVVVTRPLNGSITVANLGDATSDGTQVRVPLPSDCKVLEVTGGGQASINGITWDLENLEPGDRRDLGFVVSSEKGQLLSLEATAGGRCADDAIASSNSEIRGLPALLLEVKDESDLILVGEPVVYNIRVTNQGSAKDELIVITCQVEDGLEIVKASGAAVGAIDGRVVRFAPVPELAPDEEISYQVTVRSSRQLDSRFNVSLTSKQKTRPVSEEEATNFVN